MGQCNRRSVNSTESVGRHHLGLSQWSDDFHSAEARNPAISKSCVSSSAISHLSNVPSIESLLLQNDHLTDKSLEAAQLGDVDDAIADCRRFRSEPGFVPIELSMAYADSENVLAVTEPPVTFKIYELDQGQRREVGKRTAYVIVGATRHDVPLTTGGSRIMSLPASDSSASVQLASRTVQAVGDAPEQ